MKQFFGVALAAVTFFYAASVFAVDFKIEGEFRVRGLYSDNLSDANDMVDDQEALADGRYRVKTKASDGMASAVLVLDFFNSFNDPNNNLRCPGTNGFTDVTTTTNDTSAAANACSTGNYRFGTINFGNAYNVVGVRQAYLRVDMDHLKFVFGRKPWKLGHGLILEDIADSAATKFELGPASVILADIRLFDTHAETSGVVTTTGSGGDTDLYILKVGMNHGEEHALGFFAAYLNDRDNRFIAPELARGTLIVPGVPLGLNPLVGGSPGDSNLLTLGLTADGTVGPINGRFEVDYLTGTLDTGAGDTDLEGFNLLIGAGMPVGPASMGIDFLYTSGKEVGNPDINVNGLSGNYVFGNILLNDDINSDRDGQCASVPDANGTAFGGRVGSGSPGCLGGFGITAIKLTAALPLSESGHTELVLIYAETTEKPNAFTQISEDKDLGFEIDLNHKHRLDENLSVSVNLGWLIAGDAWKTLGDTLILDDGPGGTFLPIGVNQNGGDDDQLKGVISLNYAF